MINIKKTSKNVFVLIFIGSLFIQTLNSNITQQNFDLIFENKKTQGDSIIHSTIQDANPSSSVTIENHTIYSKQLVKDPSFTDGIDTNSWEFEQTDDLFDTFPNYQNDQIDLDVIGDHGIFTNINITPHPTDWTAVQNPAFKVWPDNYEIDGFGFNVSHIWDENVNQTTNTPSVLWKRNIEMPVNMSDYEIISASIGAIANATVDSTIDTLTDDPTVGAVGDYVRFFISIEDIAQEKSFEIAFNQTSLLGQDSGPSILTMSDTFFESIPEEVLIYYLTSVLEGNYVDFTLVAGINIYCEDNVPGADYDEWIELRINEVNLTIEYEKKINQLTSISLKQLGNKINSSEYEDKSISINNASLCFDYKISHDWPTSSQNSEIRLYINNYLHTESVKLQDFSTSWNPVKIGLGFDIASLLQVDQNVSVEIQLFIADNFILDQNITVSIDNVVLNVSYTVIESREPIETSLKTIDGKNNYDVIWNTTKTLTLNYTEVDPHQNITNHPFSVNWVDSYSNVQYLDYGIYEFDINCTAVSAGLTYSLEITPDNTGTWYNTPPLVLEINIVGRPTYCDIFSDEINLTESPIIEVPYDTQLNITSWFHDFEHKTSLLNANVTLVGNNVDNSSYSFSEIGDRYQYILNTSKLGLGTHLISIYLGKTNYEQASKQIRVKVLGRGSFFNLYLNGVNSSLSPRIDLEYNSTLNITAQLIDSLTIEIIQDAEIELTGTVPQKSLTSSGHQFIVDTINFSIGIHYLFLTSSSLKHLEYSELIEIRIQPRSVDLDIFVDATDFSIISQIEVPVNHNLTIIGALFDSEFDTSIDDVSFSLDGVNNSYVSYTIDGIYHQYIVGTAEMGLGIHFITLLAEKANYQQISKIIQVKIRPIITNITSQHYNNSYTILPGEDLNLGIVIEDLDNGGLLAGCEVSYSWRFGSGTLEENENHVYLVPLENIAEGIHSIDIIVYKGSNYKFDLFTITINVVAPSTDSLPNWVFYSMGVVIAALASSFIAYQKYFKYPKIVRDIRKLKRMVKRGVSFNPSTKTRKDLFMEAYMVLVKDSLPGKVQTQMKSTISKGNKKNAFLTDADNVLKELLPAEVPSEAEIISPNNEKTQFISSLTTSQNIDPVQAGPPTHSKSPPSSAQKDIADNRLEKSHIKRNGLRKSWPKDITFKEKPKIKELKPKE